MRINRAVSVRIEASNFVASLGGYGVAVGNGSVDCAVTGCLFDYPGQVKFSYNAFIVIRAIAQCCGWVRLCNCSDVGIYDILQ